MVLLQSMVTPPTTDNEARAFRSGEMKARSVDDATLVANFIPIQFIFFYPVLMN